MERTLLSAAFDLDLAFDLDPDFAFDLELCRMHARTPARPWKSGALAPRKAERAQPAP